METRRKDIFLLFVVTLFSIYSKTLWSQCCLNYNEQYTPTNVINTFYPPQPGSSANSGSNFINIGAVPGLDQFGNSYGTIPISAGDLLLIVQIQGASFNSTNTSNYGSGIPSSGPDALGATGITTLNNVGFYEFVIAQNDVPLSGGALQINGACSNGGLVNSYVNQISSPGVFQERFQVIRVPRYDNLTLTQDLTTTAWNGTVGGILAISVLGTLDFNGFSILANGRGFRGGYQNVRPSGNNVNTITTGDINLSSGKGEGVCGTPRFLWNGQDAVDNGAGWYGYEGGNYGRGAPGNAGGGGNIHNAGGGGGAGFGSGGVGGNGISGAGNAFPNGGRPGSGVVYNSSRLLLGGGGGGGDANNAQTGIKGGAGGGIVFITAGNVVGTGTVNVSGAAGQFGIFGAAPDGAGGGGAGGSIYFNAEQVSPTATISLIANGGAGGNTLNDASNPHGPGGGGGGGAIFYNLPAATVSTSVVGGASGSTNNGNGTPNGALPGQPGIVEMLNANINNPITSLTVYPTPVANFIEGNTCTNSIYSFIDASTVSGGSVIEEWFWDFGDGTTSTDANPTHSYASQGTYNVQLIIETNFGCRDTIIKQMQVGIPFYDTLFINECVSYTWPETGQTYVSSGTYDVLYTSAYGCDSSKVLILEINNPTSSQTIISSCDSYTWNGQTYTNSGQYTYQTVNISGCDSTAVLDLTINNSSVGFQSVNACGSFTWSASGLSYSQSGQYNATILNASGCDSLVTLDLNISPISFFTDNQIACESYTWIDGITYYTSTSTPTYTLTNFNGCDSIITLNLVIEEPFTIDAQIDQPSCQVNDGGISISIEPQGSYEFQWSQNTGVSDLTSAAVQNLSPGFYELQINSLICQLDTSFSLFEAAEILNVDISINPTTCGLQNGSIEILNVDGGTPDFTYNISGLGNSSSTIYTDLEAGQYTLQVTDSNNCNFTISDIAINSSLPITNILYSLTSEECFESNGFLSVDGIEGGTMPYLTYLNGNLLPENSANGLSSGFYNLIVEDHEGCNFETEIFINNEVSTTIGEVPNVFTPNGDGINDEWFVSAECVDTYHCSIVNRWGNLVYESFDPIDKWSGIDKQGNQLKEGVYFYLIKIRFHEENQVVQFSGFIHLVR